MSCRPRPRPRYAGSTLVEFDDEGTERVGTKRLPEIVDDCGHLWWLEPFEGNLVVHLLHHGVQFGDSALIGQRGGSDGHRVILVWFAGAGPVFYALAQA